MQSSGFSSTFLSPSSKKWKFSTKGTAKVNVFCSRSVHVHFMFAIKPETFLCGLIQTSTARFRPGDDKTFVYDCPFLLIHVFSKVLSVCGTNVSLPCCAAHVARFRQKPARERKYAPKTSDKRGIRVMKRHLCHVCKNYQLSLIFFAEGAE